MATEQVISELLIEIGVSVEGANEAAKKIGGVTKETEKADKKGGANLKKFAKQSAVAFAALGAAAVTASIAIFKLVDSVTKSADATVKGATAAGISTDSYQRLAFAADRSGASIQSISVAAKTVAKGLADAQSKGTGPFAEGLELVGLKIQDIENLNFEERLGVFGDALNRLEDPSERLAASTKLLGERAGPQLATLLAEGSEGLRVLGEEAESAGAVLGGNALEASVEFQDSMTNMKATVKGVVASVGVDLIPVVQEAIEEFQAWIKENRELISIKVKAFIQQMIPVIKTLFKIVKTLVEALGSLTEALGGIEGALIVAATAFAVFKVAMVAAGGPITGAVFAIGLLVTTLASLATNLDDVGVGLTAVEKAGLKAKDALRGKQFASAALETDIFDKTVDLKRAEEIGRGPNKEVAAKGQRLAAVLRDQLEVANKKNDAALARQARQKKTEADVRAESRGFGQDFASRQRRVQETLRDEFGTGRKADAAIQDYITGKITEEEARKRVKGKRGGRGKASAAPAAETAAAPRTLTNFEEFLQATLAPGVELAGLGTRTAALKDDQIRPEAVINITNNNHFDIDQHITGGSPVAIGKAAAAAIRAEFAKAGQSGQANVAR